MTSFHSKKALADAAKMTTADGTCKICGHEARNPFQVNGTDGIRFRCVSAAHDPHIVSNTNASAFVIQARKAGLLGVC